MSATAYNLQKLLSCIDRPKANVQILTQKQVNTLYSLLIYVVQQPGVYAITTNLNCLSDIIWPGTISS